MRRTLLLAAVVAALPHTGLAQATAVLRIRVSLSDAAGTATPIARHRLLISDNPASAPPREVVTEADGAAMVKLRPGNYTVESDEPVLFEGKAYRWVQTLDVRAAMDVVLQLTTANAEVDDEPVAAQSSELSGTALLARWQDSVTALWTPRTRTSGFVVDPRGLVATSQRAIGTATSVDVQLTAETKVVGRVLAAVPGPDVAIVWVHPSALASITPLPLACDAPARSAPVEKERAIALGVPMRGPRAAEYGTLGRIGPHALETDLDLAPGSMGGPAFAADGRLLGLTSPVDGSDERRPDFRIVRVGDVCAVAASAEKAMAGATPPDATRLPVEPTRALAKDALEAGARKHAGGRHPYQASSSDFDVAFITPAQVYGARNQVRPKSLPVAPNRTRAIDPYDEMRERALMDFGRWSDYFAEDPPVLLVRVTPRMVEGFWKMIARGAAMSQGISIPALKHFKSSFVRMQAFCGTNEVRPIHPLVVERVLSETSSIVEGLYVFRPEALGPRCGTVKLLLSAENSKDKADTLVVRPALLRAIEEEFRALTTQP